jgi:hypothetical protein
MAVNVAQHSISPASKVCRGNAIGNVPSTLLGAFVPGSVLLVSARIA